METFGFAPASTTVQVFGPVAVAGLGLIVEQLEDQPPKFTPERAGAVRITVVPIGYSAEQTDPPAPPPSAQPGPQWMTFGVPVAEGAVTSHPVAFKPSL